MKRYENVWAMRRPNGAEFYKCTECGGETHPANGHNGEPDAHQCRNGCQCNSCRVKAGSVSFRANFDAIFPNSPGAGL
ncbi:MAG: hypothetical protein HZB23_03640 [Deltaproteobacteria bacterium]|nr:hypothetical protein [Deltaproteobacteria bacterium]